MSTSNNLPLPTAVTPTPSRTTATTTVDNKTPVAAAATAAAAAKKPVAATYKNDGYTLTRYGDIGYSSDTQRLLRDIGGADRITAVTLRFYARFHRDAHLYRLLGGMQQPEEVHARRLALYIAEMMGAPGQPWTENTHERGRKRIELQGHPATIVTSRAGAHACAWHSVDREPQKVGRRFKLDDCRVWMRLLFWSARDEGFDESTPFFRYLVKFIGHFIAIYENTARRFARAESRWSADPARTAAYEASEVATDGVEGPRRRRIMSRVVDVRLSAAEQDLPPDERGDNDGWLFAGADAF